MVFHLLRRHACTALSSTIKDTWGRSVVVRGLCLQPMAGTAKLKLVVGSCPCLLTVTIYVARAMSLQRRELLGHHSAPKTAAVTMKLYVRSFTRSWR